MPALLAVLLLAATVDPRLTEPLRLLAEIGTSDTRTLGVFYAGGARCTLFAARRAPAP